MKIKTPKYLYLCGSDMIIITAFCICGPGLDYFSFLKVHKIPKSYVFPTYGITEGQS